MAIKKIEPKIQLFLTLKYNNINPKMIENTIKIMPKERVEKYNKLEKKEDKLNCLVSYYLLFYALKKNRITYQPPYFKYLKNKKPSLNFTNRIFFNISHTKNLVAVAISKETVGVDVETINNSKLKIINKIFCKEEYLKFLKSTNKEKFFFEIWTKKEAYCKRKGISIFNNVLKINTLNLKNIKTFFFENTAISVAHTKNFKLKTFYIDFKELFYL